MHHIRNFVDIASEEDAIFVPVAARQSIARKSKPSKTDVIDQHISRFPSTSARELQYVLSEELSSQDHD